jgi:osmotically-inducible protein OsmY
MLIICRSKARAALILAGFFVANSLYGQQAAGRKPIMASSASKAEENPLQHQVRHQIQALPYYSVFDYITFAIDGGKVTLTGHVLRPTLRNSAEAGVKTIEGVTSVTNLIAVLPKSPSDDDARRAVYRAIFEDSTLQRYAVSDVPQIHIVLEDGAVYLEGFVASEADKNLAGTRASGVSGVTGVKNNLAVHTKNNPPS